MTEKIDQSYNLVLKDLAVPAGWLVAPASFLVDRIVPHPEWVLLPTIKVGGGPFRVQVGSFVFVPPKKGGMRGWVLPPRETRLSDGALIVDLRVRSPENWAHFLNIHLAILACISELLDCPPYKFRILMPEKTPTYIKALIDLTGLQAIYSDDIIRGSGATFDFDTWNCIRGERHRLLSDPKISPVANVLRAGVVPDAESPARLFLARRGTRRLTNEYEVEEHLRGHGFTKVYMEDLNVAMQLQFALNAKEIVAIHGAALAPLAYRSKNSPPLRLVELFPVGHITNAYRGIAASLEANWIGVRGYIDKPHIPEVYRLDRPYRKHSLQDFRVDREALEQALRGSPVQT